MSTVNLTECLIVLRQRKPAEADALTQQLLTSSIEFTPPDTQAPALKRSARRVFRRLRTTLYHVKKPKLHRLDVTPPVVTDTNYYCNKPCRN